MPVFKIIHHSDSLTEGGDPQYIEQGFFGSHPQSLNKASVERSSELAETSTYEVNQQSSKFCLYTWNMFSVQDCAVLNASL